MLSLSDVIEKRTAFYSRVFELVDRLNYILMWYNFIVAILEAMSVT